MGDGPQWAITQMALAIAKLKTFILTNKPWIMERLWNQEKKAGDWCLRIRADGNMQDLPMHTVSTMSGIPATIPGATNTN